MERRMRVVEVAERGGRLQLAERPVPEPGPGEVRVKVEACGVCHGEMVAIRGFHPAARYPRVPGHEVIGRIDALGEGVTGWAPGQRVGIGWSGGSHTDITGLTRDGGYAEYTVARTSALVPIPDELSAVDAAPLMCAGVTTFDALRHSVARMGDVVAIQGIGGLGHLAIQYARKAGFHVVALSRGAEKRELALRLGAHAYVDTAASDPAEALNALGGAKVVLATAPDAKAISALVAGLAMGGEIVVVAGEGAPMAISPIQILPRKTVRGWVAEGPPDIADTVRFSVREQIRPMIEVFPLDRAPEALDHMLRADVRFRAVLTTG
jgi:propanol-preferring alcohol dehydrogenase